MCASVHLFEVTGAACDDLPAVLDKRHEELLEIEQLRLTGFERDDIDAEHALLT